MRLQYGSNFDFEVLTPPDHTRSKTDAGWRLLCYGAPDWSDKTLKHSEIKRFSDFQKTEKSRNDALKHWNDSGTMHGFVVRISHD